MDRLNEAIPGLLLRWYGQVHRELPWRRDREPYHVWLSEIMTSAPCPGKNAAEKKA